MKNLEEKKYNVIKQSDIKISGENELNASVYRPEEKGEYPAILICHGYLSTQDEHGDLPEKLAKLGYIVLVFDFSGHGKSQGDRGYYRSVSHLDDAERALKKLWEQEGVIKEKTAVIGHSMGTVAVNRLLGESKEGQKCKTAIIMAPVRKFIDMAGKLELEAYKVFASIAWPILLLTGKHMYLPFKVKTENIFLDQEMAKTFAKMNLLQKYMPINNYYYMIKQIDNEKFASRVNQKILVMIANQDKVVPPLTSKKVFESLANKNSKLVEIENSGHSMMMDYSKDKVFSEIESWLKENL